MSRRLLCVVLTTFVLASLARDAGAETVYIAFGDSITFGIGDTRTPPGYPPRLERILLKEGEDIKIVNSGLPGDDTFEALSRFDAAIATPARCIIIMLGTNDITQIVDGRYSIETAVENLRTMVRKARARGLDVILATIIPRSLNAKRDRDNRLSRAYTWAVRELANEMNLTLADPWERWDVNNDPDSFETLFRDERTDLIGHPNGEGYKAIAQLMADVIQERDLVAPVPGRVTPSVALTEIKRSEEIVAVLYEHRTSAGIDRQSTELLINGRVVSGPTDDSTRRKVEMRHQGKKALGCRTVLVVRSQDRADPPNVIDRVLAVWDVAGRKVIVGDVDFDCRVDGFDLISFAYRFGAREGDPLFNSLFDFNDDGVIDGKDLARLARNFGKRS